MYFFVDINIHFSYLHVVKALTVIGKPVVAGVLGAGGVGCPGGNSSLLGVVLLTLLMAGSPGHGSGCTAGAKGAGDGIYIVLLLEGWCSQAGSSLLRMMHF